VGKLPEDVRWGLYFRLVEVFIQENGKFPDPDDVQDAVAVGKWLDQQRKLNEIGMLSSTRSTALSSLQYTLSEAVTPTHEYSPEDVVASVVDTRSPVFSVKVVKPFPDRKSAKEAAARLSGLGVPVKVSAGEAPGVTATVEVASLERVSTEVEPHGYTVEQAKRLVPVAPTTG